MSNLILNQKFIINIETTNNIKKTLKDSLGNNDPTNRKLFEEGSPEIRILGDHLAGTCRSIIDNNPEIKKFSNQHYDEAREKPPQRWQANYQT